MRGSPGKSVMRRRLIGWGVALGIGLVALSLAVGGWGKWQRTQVDASAAVTATVVRDQRRAFAGAPPVIPHRPLGGACIHCHTDSGRWLPDVGYAPANPHRRTRGMAAARCQQCHVFRVTDRILVTNDFEPFRRSSPHGRRAYPQAPPTIPHRLFMREDCAACHCAPTARPEVRCTHPERLNCRQCHVPGVVE